MKMNEMRDPMLRLLASLPSAAPPAAVDQRIRSRCHLALEKQRPLPQRRAQAVVPGELVNAALAMAAGIYAAAVTLEALRLAGML